MTSNHPPVRQFMTVAPVTIRSDFTLQQAATTMKEQAVRHLPVVDAHGTLVGVLSAREVHTICGIPDLDLTRVTASYVAMHDVFTVGPETALDVVCAEMAEHRYGCAVIVDGHRVVGIFTTTDACAALAAFLRGNGGPLVAS